MVANSHLSKFPVLIIGGGIAGLILGQALKKRSIPFLIFERDEAANSRLQGWGLTIHFGLPQLLQLLPEELHEEIDLVQVNPNVSHDKGNSIFISLADCQVKWRLPLGSGTRKRVARDRFRLMLMKGLKEHILWGKRFQFFHCRDEVSITAHFHDGSSYDGLLLVGADGAASKVRSLLYDMKSLPPIPIPISFLGTSIEVGEDTVMPLLELDPILFQGCHPVTATFMWFSVMESPETNGTRGLPREQQVWKIQLCLSWPTEGDGDIPQTDAERINKMRERASGFDPRLRTLFNEVLPDDHKPILSIKLQDWCLPSLPSPRSLRGRVTLTGDAAHTMVMYRGEGFNHAILDNWGLTAAVQRIYDTLHAEDAAAATEVRDAAIAEFQADVRRRGSNAVHMCREACLEVHQWETLSEKSTVRQKSIL
jgi:2-polyprenyl-6-methoxyphenol hydroxylase-like FAD-dependent oxidoreductase